MIRTVDGSRVRTWLDAGRSGADPLDRPQRVYALSVIIPSHDAGRHLEACFDSLVGASSGPLEVLVIDDGSTDGSIEGSRALERLGAKHVVSVVRQQRAGAAAARNLGLRLASGCFVAMLDADDAYEEGALDVMLDAARSSGSDLVLCRSCLLDDATGARNPFPDAALWNHVLQGQHERVVTASGDPIVYLLSPSPCPRLASRAMLEASGVRFPERVRYGEDLAPHIGWLGAARRLHLVDRVLFAYRQTGSHSAVGRPAFDADDAMGALKSACAAARRVGIGAREGGYVTYRLLARWAWQALQFEARDRAAFIDEGHELFAGLPRSWIRAFLREVAPDRALLEETTGRVLFDHHSDHDYGVLLRALRRGRRAYLNEALSDGPSLRATLHVLVRDGAWLELLRRGLAHGTADKRAARRRS